MIVGKVVGEITATIGHPFYGARKLLIVDKGGLPGAPVSAGYVIAIDTVGAGVGETVLVVDEGTGARQILGSKDGPVRSVVAGIVDAVETEG